MIFYERLTKIDRKMEELNGSACFFNGTPVEEWEEWATIVHEECKGSQVTQ